MLAIKCDFCGSYADGPSRPKGWRSSQIDEHPPLHICDRCAARAESRVRARTDEEERARPLLTWDRFTWTAAWFFCGYNLCETFHSRSAWVAAVTLVWPASLACTNLVLWLRRRH